MGKKIRRTFSSIAFFILLYAIYRFYSYTTGTMPQPEEIPGIIVMGILLIISIGIVSASRYYYGAMDKNQTIKGKELDAELKAYDIMADEIKSTPIDSAKQQNNLKN